MTTHTPRKMPAALGYKLVSRKPNAEKGEVSRKQILDEARDYGFTKLRIYNNVPPIESKRDPDTLYIAVNPYNDNLIIKICQYKPLPPRCPICRQTTNSQGETGKPACVAHGEFSEDEGYTGSSTSQPSAGEQAFEAEWRRLYPEIPLGKQTKVIKERDWAFDFTVGDRIAVEIDGGQWAAGGGRHGGEEDFNKMNTAAGNGWLVFHFRPKMVADDAQECVEAVARAFRRWQ